MKVKLKSPPRSLPRRHAEQAALPLAPMATIFASGALVAALMACRATPDAAASDPVTAAPLEAASAEKTEEPLRLQAPDAPSARPVPKGASNVPPVPTSVVIRPGHEPIRMAGMMPIHRGDDT